MRSFNEAEETKSSAQYSQLSVNYGYERGHKDLRSLVTCFQCVSASGS